MSEVSNTPSVLRTKCRYCHYSVRLRLNGLPQRHTLYSGGDTWVCPGGEMGRRQGDWPPHAVAYFLEDPDLYPQKTRFV